MRNLVKEKHAAACCVFKLKDKQTNVRYSDAKRAVIVAALEDRDTDCIFLTSKNQVCRQMLNGCLQTLQKVCDEYTNYVTEYIFIND
jgi:hypothetical protein